MGRRRYGGRRLEKHESLPADSALAATLTSIFWARLVSHRSGLCFSFYGESGDTRSPSKLLDCVSKFPSPSVRERERVRVKRANHG
jgi:hypothetical protein